MSRKMTPLLLSLALILGLITYITECSSPQSRRASRPQSARILDIDVSEIRRIRVKRDYWNSYALQRNPDTSWQIIEPSNEAASPQAVQRLLAVIQEMPISQSIDLPANDTERHREYGLWLPVMELTVTTDGGEHTLIFGRNTPDRAGAYCAEVGRDRVLITSASVLQALAVDPASLRASN